VAGLPESGHIEDQNKTTINSFSGYDPEFLSKNKEVNTVEVKQQSQTFCVMMAADTTNVSPPLPNYIPTLSKTKSCIQNIRYKTNRTNGKNLAKRVPTKFLLKCEAESFLNGPRVTIIIIGSTNFDLETIVRR